MFKNFLFVFLLLISFAYSQISYAQESITCYQRQEVEKPINSLTSQVNDVFGNVVGKMAAVLFWSPFQVEKTDEKGQAIYKQEPVKNAQGESLEKHFVLIESKKNPVYHKNASLCINAKGEAQYSQNNLPYFTNWTLQDGQFVHAEPFTLPNLKIIKTSDEKLVQKTESWTQPSQTPDAVGVPLVVIVLSFGAVFYTLFYGFINFRLFKHAIDCVRGVFDNPKDPGEISHLQALTSALSATVGLGNIAGVAVAVGLGGPGAVFWMILLGLLGMSSKFHECTLGQMYRWIDVDGNVHGGPKYYLSRGFNEMKLTWLGKILAFVFAIFVIGGSFGGGNMFQANQSFQALAGEFPVLAEYDLFFGIFMAALVGLVIVGGIKRIGQVTEKLIPFMCALYILASLFIIFSHFSELPEVIGLVFSNAFDFQAGFAGFLGVAIIGIQRAVFSNEAGIGSASIAHSAAKTDEPVREGVVALLEPFIDTVVICSMTAFVVLVTGAYNNPLAGSGVEMTRFAFGEKISWFPTVLSISVFLFAFSTMISWSYYGEKGWTYLFGYSKRAVMTYKFIFLFFVVLGTIASLGNIIDFSDLMILSMAFPNIIGGIWLSGKVKKRLDDYLEKLNSGKMKRYK